jgi:hypothetical protein
VQPLPTRIHCTNYGRSVQYLVLSYSIVTMMLDMETWNAKTWNAKTVLRSTPLITVISPSGFRLIFPRRQSRRNACLTQESLWLTKLGQDSKTRHECVYNGTESYCHGVRDCRLMSLRQDTVGQAVRLKSGALQAGRVKLRMERGKVWRATCYQVHTQRRQGTTIESYAIFTTSYADKKPPSCSFSNHSTELTMCHFCADYMIADKACTAVQQRMNDRGRLVELNFLYDKGDIQMQRITL